MTAIFFLAGSVPRLAEPNVAIRKNFFLYTRRDATQSNHRPWKWANVMGVPTGTEHAVIAGVACEVGQSQHLSEKPRHPRFQYFGTESHICVIFD